MAETPDDDHHEVRTFGDDEPVELYPMPGAPPGDYVAIYSGSDHEPVTVLPVTCLLRRAVDAAAAAWLADRLTAYLNRATRVQP